MLVCHVPLKVLPCGVCREQICTFTRHIDKPTVTDLYAVELTVTLPALGLFAIHLEATAVCRTPLKLAENRIPTKLRTLHVVSTQLNIRHD